MSAAMTTCEKDKSGRGDVVSKDAPRDRPAARCLAGHDCSGPPWCIADYAGQLQLSDGMLRYLYVRADGRCWGKVRTMRPLCTCTASTAA